ncbi:hypothetical protein SAMN05661080_02133 [Modestobacter sp. DSM 44400]|nr:hypothetical protein SAMN05661080_02133 [Modestobacter sp. DSM 44400]
MSIAVVGTEVAVLFRAVATDGTTTEVFDVMSFTDQGHIACTWAYWPAGAGDAAPSEPDARRPSTRRPGPPGSR